MCLEMSGGIGGLNVRRAILSNNIGAEGVSAIVRETGLKFFARKEDAALHGS